MLTKCFRWQNSKGSIKEVFEDIALTKPHNSIVIITSNSNSSNYYNKFTFSAICLYKGRQKTQM